MRLSRMIYETERYTSLAANLVRCRLATHTPVFLTHIVTDFCNLRCQFCDLWKEQKTKDIHNELTTQEVFRLLDQAREAGMVSYTLWGGEPLLRKDIGDILEYAHRKKFFVSMITNGYNLEEKSEVVGKYVDHLIISLDGIGTVHDELRGKDGSYGRAVHGMLAVKDRVRIIINSVVCKKNLGEIDKLYAFAKSQGVHITYEPIERLPGFNDHLVLSEDQKAEVFSHLRELKQASGVIANSYTYFNTLAEKRAYTCHAPKMYITVHADGEIHSCKGTVWGNVRKDNLKNALRSPEYSAFCTQNEQCNNCVVSCVIETSNAYELKPAYYYDMIKSLIF